MENGEVPLLSELLTTREREVLQLLAEGHGTKEVAFRLQVSPKTVETHRLSLFAKLKVGGVADLESPVSPGAGTRATPPVP